jgi:tRNA modification GTPase
LTHPQRDNAIVLTPPGSAAIAVVRLRGAGVARFLADHFSRPAAPSRCLHGDLRDGDTILDDPIVILFDDGRSAEIHLHGGPWVVAATLDLLRRGGFDVIEPSAGAALDVDRVDGESLLEREVLAYLPLARTEEGIRLLLAQVGAWRAFLSDPSNPPALDRVGDLGPMLFPPRVAIIGRPNVGKSTLANQLFAQERSLTADLPGTTRDWVGELANIDGLAVVLIDTPGRRQTADPIERAAIAGSGEVVRAAELVIEVIDAADSPEVANVDDHRGSGGVTSAPPGRRGTLIVLNKIDRGTRRDVQHDLETIATTGHGVDALRRAIRAQFGFAEADPRRPMAWTARHADILTRAQHDPRALHALIS